MILYLLNYSKGILKISVTGSYMERFFNLCAMNNINIWNISRVDLGEIHLNILVGDYRRLRKIIDNSKCSSKIISKNGLPSAILKVKKRYALILGFFVCFLVQYMLTNYLFDINITGTENTAVIYDMLCENDIKIGSKISDIDVKMAQNDIMAQNEDLLWISINLKGNMANVEVSKRYPLPEIIPKDIPCDIVAEKTGMIDSIDVLAGQKIIDVGHTFIVGDVLVSAEPQSFPQVVDISPRLVHSIANIKATIWYDLNRVLPKEISVKNYTGREKTRYTIIFGKKAINLFKNTGNPYTFYDKIVDTNKIKLSSSVTIPIYLKTERYIEYTNEVALITDELGFNLLESNLLDTISRNINGDIINTQIVKNSNDKTISVDISLETLEDIGVKQQR